MSLLLCTFKALCAGLFHAAEIPLASKAWNLFFFLLQTTKNASINF